MAMAMECVQMDTWDKDRTEHTNSGKHGRAYFSNLDTEELGQMSLGSGVGLLYRQSSTIRLQDRRERR